MISWILTLIAAASLVAAWWHPSTGLCAALAWSSVVLFRESLANPRKRYLRLWVAGMVTYLGGFYWLFWTIKDFGGFPLVAALPIFLLFAVGSSVQFLIWAFSWQHLPQWCTRWGIRTAVAWLIAHHFWIKIFPWDFGHTQIAFTPFAQLAGVTGVSGVTFVMMWLAEALSARRVVSLRARVCAVATFCAALGYGLVIQETINSIPPKPLSTVMIQGNVSLRRKHDMSYFTVNREQYLSTSRLVSARDSLVVWPESTITEFIPSDTADARFAPLLPFLNDGSAFLVGGLTYRSRSEYFNSSILVRPDGSVATPYNKMILMPFGEYTPLASLLPWLQEINATAGQFTAGESVSVLSFQLSNGTEVKLSPLICYEDVVADPARQATAQGAELLINQTNDAWFGDTVAPYQHHMIASFRAIENRRFLLRSTNTGLTAAVDPLGRTLASLLPYSESVLPMEVSLLSYKSTWTSLPIYLVWQALAIITAFACIIRAWRLRSRGANSV